jgi:hypothetical protein
MSGTCAQAGIARPAFVLARQMLSSAAAAGSPRTPATKLKAAGS